MRYNYHDRNDGPDILDDLVEFSNHSNTSKVEIWCIQIFN